MNSHQQRFNLNNGTTWAKSRIQQQHRHRRKNKPNVADDDVSLSAFIIGTTNDSALRVYVWTCVSELSQSEPCQRNERTKQYQNRKIAK